MAILHVNRGTDRRITEITREVDSKEYVFVVGVALFMIFGSLCILAFPIYKVHLFEDAFAIFGFCAGIATMIMAVSRARSAHPVNMLVADSQGLKFYSYQELGTVPWSSVKGFETASSPIATLGKSVLVAQLYEPETYQARLNKHKGSMATLQQMLPFATLDGSGHVDLPALQAALNELREQELESKPLTIAKESKT